MRTAIGFKAGPDIPPVILPRRGFHVRVSITIPVRVFIRAKASAPASSTALAIFTISVTFGDNFTITGLLVLAFTSLVTSAATSGSVPKANPSAFTFGQEILTSIASTPSTSNFLAIMPNSSTLPAEKLTIKVVSGAFSFTFGNTSDRNFSIPGFSRPMQFNMPAGVSAILKPGLPARGRGVIPFEIIAPTCFKSIKSSYSTPKPKVPEAPITGVGILIPAKSVFNLSIFIGILLPISQKPPLPQIQVHHRKSSSVFCSFYLQRYSQDKHQFRKPCVFPRKPDSQFHH